MLGKTGMELSALSLGATALGDSYGPTDRTESIAVVHEAIQKGKVDIISISVYFYVTYHAGINFIDTAPWFVSESISSLWFSCPHIYISNILTYITRYGFEKGEKVLGEALASIPRQAYYISTKVGRYPTVPCVDITSRKIQAERAGAV